MRLLGALLVLLLLAGGAAWWFRDSLPFLDRTEPVEVSPEAAAQARAKLARLGDGDSVRLSSVELSSLLRYGSPEWVPVGLTSPEIQMNGDTMLVAAIIPTDRIPSHPDLDRVRSLLPDSARVEVVGSVRTLDGGGRGALTVRQVEFAGIPIPERYYPPMLEQIGRGEEPGLAETEMALPLPSGVSEVRVEDGFLLLIP